MRILADTSIWIGHFRTPNTILKSFLEDGAVLMHPCIHGELALGSMKDRVEVLKLLAALPESDIATNDEVLFVIERKQLWSLGIGWIDAQLLAAARLTSDCSLWTFDVSLRKAAEKAGAKSFHGAA